MKTVKRETLASCVGGSTAGSCFAFGLGVAVIVANWYNPLAYFGAELAVVGAVGCFG